MDSDEDNSDEGIRMVTRILGADRINPYYQLILQLVMADGAYTEGFDVTYYYFSLSRAKLPRFVSNAG